ncbi:MAG: FMN-binding protein, partial [Clostridioides difficile]|nr:FMN-binding protein [Clostridioides difficile]
MKIRNKATNKKKKYVKISIALFFVFICIIIVIVSNLKPENLVVKDIDINNVKNGIYTGSADNNLVKAT